MTDKVILGIPFISTLYPYLVENDGITTDHFKQKVKFKFVSKFEVDTSRSSNSLLSAKTKHLNFLQQEIKVKKISKQLSSKLLWSKIDDFQNTLIFYICSDIPNVSLPYIKDFSERNIPTKAKLIQMNGETLKFCKNKISDLFAKNIIRLCKSPGSCATFYI